MTEYLSQQGDGDTGEPRSSGSMLRFISYHPRIRVIEFVSAPARGPRGLKERGRKRRANSRVDSSVERDIFLRKRSRAMSG